MHKAKMKFEPTLAPDELGLRFDDSGFAPTPSNNLRSWVLFNNKVSSKPKAIPFAAACVTNSFGWPRNSGASQNFSKTNRQ